MIDKEKVLEGLERFKADFKPFCGNNADWKRVDDAIVLLKEQEAIIRCKDCKHFEPDGIYTMCYRHNGLSQNADWFCADGEKDRGQMKRPKETFWDSLSEADLMEPMRHFED